MHLLLIAMPLLLVAYRYVMLCVPPAHPATPAPQPACLPAAPRGQPVSLRSVLERLRLRRLWLQWLEQPVLPPPGTQQLLLLLQLLQLQRLQLPLCLVPLLPLVPPLPAPPVWLVASAKLLASPDCSRMFRNQGSLESAPQSIELA